MGGVLTFNGSTGVAPHPDNRPTGAERRMSRREPRFNMDYLSTVEVYKYRQMYKRFLTRKTKIQDRAPESA